MRSLVTLFLGWVLLLSGSSLQAQVYHRNDAPKKAQKAWNKAFEAFQESDWERSEKQIQVALAEAPGFVEAHLLAGDLYDRTGRREEAIVHYRRGLELDPDGKPAAWYRLGVMLTREEAYAEAIAPLEEYVSRVQGERLERGRQELERVRFAAEAVAHPVAFDPVNLGDAVNGPDPEYLPSFTLDGELLVYTKRLGGRNEDFFASRRTEEGWEQARNLGPPVNTDLNEGAQFLSADGRHLLYTICSRPGGLGSCDIYISERKGERWSEPRNMGPAVNSPAWDSQPCLTADGRQLYFTSNRAGGQGGMDLWMSRMGPDGRWTDPVNLGPTINTGEAEQSPFLHPDGATLYFASDGHTGMGGTDLFLSRLDLNGDWTVPQNLGYPINTTASEGSLTVSTDGILAFYASDRKDSRGGLDLYQFELPEALRPQPVTYVEATVRDALTKEPLAAVVELFDLASAESLTRSSSDGQRGAFLVCLPSGKEYMLNVERKDYLFHSEHFELAEGQAYEPFTLTIDLIPMTPGREVRLNNVFFESGSARLDSRSRLELDRLAKLMREQPQLRIRINGHTDDVGDDGANLRLSEARSASVKDYIAGVGIPVERLESKGWGESKPVAPNEWEEGRALNRRTTFEVLD